MAKELDMKEEKKSKLGSAFDAIKKGVNMASTANLGNAAKQEAIQTAEPKTEAEPEKNFVDNSNEAISKAKAGDFIKRNDGTEYQLQKGDIDYATKQAMTALVETSDESDQSIMEGNPTAIAAKLDELETEVAKPGEMNVDGTVSKSEPLDEPEFMEEFTNKNDLGTVTDEEGNVKLTAGKFNATAPTTFEQQRMANNPYAQRAQELEKEYNEQKTNIDFAAKLTKYSAIMYMFSGGKIPFIDFRQLTPRDAYDEYRSMMQKAAEYQDRVSGDVQKSADQRVQGQYGLLQGKQQQETAMKQIDAQAEADLRRYDAQTMGQLEIIREQGNEAQKMAKLQALIQSQEMGNMIDDLRGRGYSEKDIAHWIMATKLGISPGQQAYQNIMSGIKAGSDVVSAISSFIPGAK